MGKQPVTAYGKFARAIDSAQREREILNRIEDACRPLRDAVEIAHREKANQITLARTIMEERDAYRDAYEAMVRLAAAVMSKGKRGG